MSVGEQASYDTAKKCVGEKESNEMAMAGEHVDVRVLKKQPGRYDEEVGAVDFVQHKDVEHEDFMVSRWSDVLV